MQRQVKVAFVGLSSLFQSAPVVSKGLAMRGQSMVVDDDVLLAAVGTEPEPEQPEPTSAESSQTSTAFGFALRKAAPVDKSKDNEEKIAPWLVKAPKAAPTKNVLSFKPLPKAPEPEPEPVKEPTPEPSPETQRRLSRQNSKPRVNPLLMPPPPDPFQTVWDKEDTPAAPIDLEVAIQKPRKPSWALEPPPQPPAPAPINRRSSKALDAEDEKYGFSPTPEQQVSDAWQARGMLIVD